MAAIIDLPVTPHYAEVSQSCVTSSSVVLTQSWSSFRFASFLPSWEDVEGERFAIEVEGDRILLVHPQWSLIGSGNTVEEARAQLLTEARDLARVMADDDTAMLSDEAVRLRDYVRRVR